MKKDSQPNAKANPRAIARGQAQRAAAATKSRSGANTSRRPVTNPGMAKANPNGQAGMARGAANKQAGMARKAAGVANKPTMATRRPANRGR